MLSHAEKMKLIANSVNENKIFEDQDMIQILEDIEKNAKEGKYRLDLKHATLEKIHKLQSLGFMCVYIGTNRSVEDDRTYYYQVLWN